jgi:hypothetical protein
MSHSAWRCHSTGASRSPRQPQAVPVATTSCACTSGTGSRRRHAGGRRDADSPGSGPVQLRPTPVRPPGRAGHAVDGTGRLRRWRRRRYPAWSSDGASPCPTTRSTTSTPRHSANHAVHTAGCGLVPSASAGSRPTKRRGWSVSPTWPGTGVRMRSSLMSPSPRTDSAKGSDAAWSPAPCTRPAEPAAPRTTSTTRRDMTPSTEPVAFAPTSAGLQHVN